MELIFQYTDWSLRIEEWREWFSTNKSKSINAFKGYLPYKAAVDKVGENKWKHDIISPHIPEASFYQIEY